MRRATQFWDLFCCILGSASRQPPPASPSSKLLTEFVFPCGEFRVNLSLLVWIPFRGGPIDWKNSRSPSGIEFSSGNEHFKRATHQGRFLFWGGGNSEGQDWILRLGPLVLLNLSAINLWGRSGRGHCRKFSANFREISTNFSAEFPHPFLAQWNVVHCKFPRIFRRISANFPQKPLR